MPFTSALDPVLFHIGPLSVRWYGLAYAVGFLFAWWWLKQAVKKQYLQLTEQKLSDFIFWSMIGVVIGARLGHVLFWNLQYFLTNPIKIFAVWEGGLSFHGALIGIIIVGLWFCNREKISFYRMADLLTIPAAFALALGRIANFINGELYGQITNVSWCVSFPTAEGCRHPYQIYSAIARATVGLLLLSWYKQFATYKEGFFFWMFLTLFGLERFLLDFFRVDSRWLMLSTGQWLSSIMIVAGGYMLWKHYWHDNGNDTRKNI